MSLAGFNLAVTITAIDRFTNTFGKVNQLGAKMDNYFGRLDGSIAKMVNPLNALGAGLGGVVLHNLQENETAAVQLQNSMMKAGGVISPFFDKIAQKAEQLGVALPGATSDFYAMASTLKNLGLKDESIDKSLEATAKLAVLLKPMGESYESVATGVAKFKNALGVADEDMIKFADTVQRTGHMGVSITEMQYAFARMSASTKLLDWQGLEHADKLAGITGMLIQMGKSGETTGSALNKIFMMGRQKGAFKDEEGMFQWLEKMSEKDLTKIFGGGDDLNTAITLQKAGLKGFTEFQDKMKAQASLDERSKNSLNSLSNIIEAMQGTFVKVSVSLGKLFGSDLKNIFNSLNNFADGLSNFIDKHQTLAKVVSQGALAFVGFRASIQLFNVFGSVVSPLVTAGKAINNFHRVSKLLSSAEAAGNMTRYYRTLELTGQTGQIASGRMGSLASRFSILNPYVLGGVAVVGALGLAYYGYNEYTARSIDLTKSMGDAQKYAQEATSQERSKLLGLWLQLEKTNPETKERLELVKQLKSEFPEYKTKMDLEKASLNDLKQGYEAVVEQMIKKKQLEGIQNQINEAVSASVEFENKKISSSDGFLSKAGKMLATTHFSVAGVNAHMEEQKQKKITEAQQLIQVRSEVVLDGKTIATAISNQQRIKDRTKTVEENRLTLD